MHKLLRMTLAAWPEITGTGLPKPDRSAAFLKELAANGPASGGAVCSFLGPEGRRIALLCQMHELALDMRHPLTLLEKQFDTTVVDSESRCVRR